MKHHILFLLSIGSRFIGFAQLTPDTIYFQYVQEPARIHIADLNSDSVQDIIVAGSRSAYYTYEASSDSYKPHRLTSVPANRDALADINGDHQVEYLYTKGFIHVEPNPGLLQIVSLNETGAITTSTDITLNHLRVKNYADSAVLYASMNNNVFQISANTDFSEIMVDTLITTPYSISSFWVIDALQDEETDFIIQGLDALGINWLYYYVFEGDNYVLKDSFNLNTSGYQQFFALKSPESGTDLMVCTQATNPYVYAFIPDGEQLNADLISIADSNIHVTGLFTANIGMNYETGLLVRVSGSDSIYTYQADFSNTLLRDSIVHDAPGISSSGFPAAFTQTEAVGAPRLVYFNFNNLLGINEPLSDPEVLDILMPMEDHFIIDNQLYGQHDVGILFSDTSLRVQSIDGDTTYVMSSLYVEPISNCFLDLHVLEDGDFDGDGLGDLMLQVETYWDNYCDDAAIYTAINDSTLVPVYSLRSDSYAATRADLSDDNLQDFLVTYFGSDYYSEAAWGGGFVLHQSAPGSYASKLSFSYDYEDDVYEYPLGFVQRKDRTDVSFIKETNGEKWVYIYRFEDDHYVWDNAFDLIHIGKNDDIYLVEGKGNMDNFLYVKNNRDTLYIFPQNNGGTFGKKVPVNVFPETSGSTGDISLHDLNLDGRRDILYNNASDTTFYLLNDPTYGFTGTWCSLQDISSPRVRQVDDNPLPDIFSSNQWGVYIYYNVETACAYEPGVLTQLHLPVESFEYLVFPNPASQILQVEGAFPISGMKYRVTNTSGMAVLSGLVNAWSQHAIDVSALPPGMYILQLTSDNRQQSTPFLIQR